MTLPVLNNNSFSWSQTKWFSVLLLCLLGIGAYSQSLQLSQSVSDANPAEEQAFEYLMNIACNSTTGDCWDTQITGTLPDHLDFISFSTPLPAGVGSATYDPATRQYIITFNQGDGNDLAQGSTIQLSMQVIFPENTLTGASANNVATASAANAASVNASATATVSNGQRPIDDFPNDKSGTWAVVPGGEIYWTVQVGNMGYQNITNYEVVDMIPNGVTLTEVRTPMFEDLNHLGDLYYQRSDSPGTWIWWDNFNFNSKKSKNVSDLGLPGGVNVIGIRLTLGTIPGGGLFNPYRYNDSYATSMNIYALSNASDPDGTTYTNCASWTGTLSGSNISATDCTTTNIDSSVALHRPSGSMFYTDLDRNPIEFATIGDTILVEFHYYSDPDMVDDIYGGVIMSVLPPGLDFVPGSWGYAWDCSDNLDNQEPVLQSGTLPDGRDYLRLVYDNDFGNVFNLEANGYWMGCGYNYQAVVTPGTPLGWIDGSYYYNATEPHFTDCGTADTEGYLNGYAPSYCADPYNSIQIILPPSSAGVDSRKEVIGTLDSDYSRYPATGTTVPGGLSNYRITLKNPNSTPIDNIVIIDVLPDIGDTEVLDGGTARSSQWRPNLAQQISVPSGVAVQYSTVSNPCRDELAGSNPTPFPSGCNTPNWNAVAPADITDVTALRFDLFGVTLNQNDSVVIEWDMRAPVNAPIGGEVSWNSFAYIAQNASTNATLLPAEPIKVGIQTQPGTVPIAGDFVWDDLNGNGLQDAGEPGIDGVRVALIEDTNNNNIAEPGGADVEYTWTISANGGQYIFSDFPTGRYFLEFTNLPTGYVETHRDVGSDDGIDSDGLITDIITFTGTSDFRGIDVGLYNGVLPPLWSCATTLLNNNDFASGFTSWADWGNTSLTNDTYVGANAMLINGGSGGRGQQIPVNPGETYTLSFYAKHNGAEESYGGINFKDVNNNTIYELNRRVYENTYEYHSVTATAPPGAVRLEVYGFKHAGGGASYYDAFCLEQVNDVCPGGSKPDADADGICQEYDIDDDNDGIKDEDEVICIGDVGAMVQWHHNDPADTGIPDIYAPGLITSADNEVFGTGIGAYFNATLVRLSGVDQPDLASAIADGDYLEYSFTTASAINSLHLEYFAHTKHGVSSGALMDNYGYDFTVLVSDDGFVSSTPIVDIVTVDNNINPSFESLNTEADDNYYYLTPNTEYTFRVYFYNKTTDPNVDAFFDDFILYAEYCDLPIDVDGDGVANADDLDSDNDGLTDLTESGHGATDTDHDGVIDGANTDSGVNGLDDGVETTADLGDINYVISDSESLADGIYDPYELDSDGDGCYDTYEGLIQDSDGDGVAGTGLPTVDARGLVSTVLYDTPLNNDWQNPSINVCNREICNNGIDDDSDGLVDCDDGDCDGVAGCDIICTAPAIPWRNNNWIFGNSAWLDFSDGDPIYRSGANLNTIEGTTVASGPDGALLFYSNGVEVRNVNHQVMPNGAGLLGGTSTTNAAVAYQNPADPAQYYLFAADDGGSPDSVSYSIIDMRLDGGLGDVTAIKNIKMAGRSEGLCIIPHPNGEDAWIVTMDYTTQTVYVTPLTAAGVGASTAFTYSFPINFSNYANIQASSNYDRIVITRNTVNGGLYLFDFDPNTGTLSNDIYISTGDKTYGAEFSPSGDYLYITAGSDREIYQLTLTGNNTAADIWSSKYVYEYSGLSIYGLEMGPNGIIYVSIYDRSIGGFLHPDEYGPAAQYRDNLIPSVPSNRIRAGLPTLVNGGCVLLPEVCNDGIDNDGDGLVDCEDGDCYLVANTGGLDYDGDGIDDYCDLDDDNDGIPDLDECNSEVLLDLAGASSTILNGVNISSRTTFNVNDTVFFTQVGVLSNGRTIDARIILTSATPGAFYDPDISAIVLGNSDGPDDDHLTFILEIIDAVTGQILPFKGRVIFQDIDTGNLSDYTEVVGIPPYETVSLGANLMPLDYQNGGGSGPAYTTFGINPAVAGDPTDWYDETATTPGNSAHWVTAQFNRPAGLDISFGVTGTDNFISTRNLHLDNVYFSDCDPDGDGYSNEYDLDSDNDGIYDAVEAGHGQTHSNGTIVASVGVNGLVDNVETSADSDVINYGISDSETTPDGTYDPYELDSDDDGCFDTIESQVSSANDSDGYAGSGPPSVDINGRVLGQSYSTPSNNWWQDPLYNFCQSCRTATTNPHIMYYRSR